MALLRFWKLWLLLGLLAAVGVQEVRVRLLKSAHESYVASIEKQVAENKVQNALEQARIERNGKEALDALTTRYAALNARYRVLRDSRSSPPVPSASDAIGLAQSCPGIDGQPNPVAGRMESLEAGIESILEAGDREIAKYVELWKLQEANRTVP